MFQDMVTYSVQPQPAASDAQYVYVNPSTGFVTLIKMFKKETKVEYMVRTFKLEYETFLEFSVSYAVVGLHATIGILKCPVKDCLCIQALVLCCSHFHLCT